MGLLREGKRKRSNNCASSKCQKKGTMTLDKKAKKNVIREQQQKRKDGKIE